jgi:glycosyltransferase involved in cell wall biosynthesis
MSLPISVFIIARNEERRIGNAIRSVRDLAGEIVVVDSGSTDRTVDIARELGAVVHKHAWTGFGPQKRYAEDKCRHDWLLNLDADEVVTPDLAEEIRALFSNRPPEPAAYTLRILNVYPGDEKPRPFANDYKVVRLYNRSVARYRDHPVFDRVEVREGAPARTLRAPAFHHSIIDWYHMVDKANRFTDHRLDAMAAKARWKLKLRLATEFPLHFIRHYVFRRHLFGGHKGLIFALNTAFLRTLRIAKILERQEQMERDGLQRRSGKER